MHAEGRSYTSGIYVPASGNGAAGSIQAPCQLPLRERPSDRGMRDAPCASCRGLRAAQRLLMPRIEEGQILCIVEAMKLMNEITSDVAGELVAVLHENAQPVEYGQELFAIRAD